MPARLFLVSGGQVEPGSPFVLPPNSSVVVGRGTGADLVLLDEEASRSHFRIRHDGNRYVLEDLGSANGTYVNDELVRRPVPLAHGDIVQAGRTCLRFSTAADDSQAGSSAATASSVVEVGEEGGASTVRVQLTPPPGQPRAHPDHTVRNFMAKHRGETANKVFTWYQKLWYLAILVGLVVLLNWHPLHFLHVFHVFCTFYIVVILYKLVAVVLSIVSPGEIKVSREELAALRDEELPVYTILVPLYHETEVARKIIRYIRRLDYPREKLDVKLLLEEDDRGTQEVCRRARLPANYELVVVPDCVPKTKPKACNHGLERARGEYLVIYDGEDRPEPDQLKKAVVGFQKANAHRGRLARWFLRRSETVCLQAKLNYYNPDQNLLTKWFAIEYSTWFDLFLPGLHRLGSPIPLGGTSNHFKTSVLRSIGGWDPFNVAEDCDLGIRLHKLGYKTQILDSTTWEEANSRVWNWVRQRSRWVKGYIQTHLVHMRHPLRTFWKLGFAGMLGFLTSVGGLSLMLILNPLFWLILLFYGACWVHDLALQGWSWEATRLFQASYQPGMWPWDRWLNFQGPWVWRMWFDDPTGDPFWNTWSQIFYIVTVVLFLANFVFVFMHLWACVRRRLFRLIPHALFTPFYWVLISLGAWKGFLQLFTRPFKWEKTHHGLDEAARTHRG